MLQVLLVRVEKVNPDEKGPGRHRRIAEKSNGGVGQTSRRMELVDVRALRRVAIEARLLEALETIDPAQIGAEKKVRGSSRGVVSDRAKPLCQKDVLAGVLHLVPIGARHFRGVAACHQRGQGEAGV